MKSEERRRRVEQIKNEMKRAEQWQVARKRLIWGVGGLTVLVGIGITVYYFMRTAPLVDDDFVTVTDEL